MVERIRASQQAAARAALVEVSLKLESAEIELRRARKEASDHDLAKKRFEAKWAIPEQGCRGVDLQREASYAFGLFERERLLKDKIVRAQRACDRLRNEVDALQSALERSHKALEAVERHHQKFNAEQERERTDQAESDRDDLYSIPR